MVVGIDISKDWFDAAWAEEGGTLHQQRFAYTSEGIGQLLARTSAEALFAMEATGTYHSRLAVALHEAGRALCVINPLVIRRYAQMKLSRVKSDASDAALIMRYALEEHPARWRPAPEEVQQLQQAHGWLQDLTGERTRLVNRQQALALRSGPSAFVQRQMRQELAQLQRHIADCERHLQGLVKKSFERLNARLQTIPSIGAKTALELLIVTEGFTRFTRVKALAAYVGASPTTWRSGSSVHGKGGIAKYGQSRMRQLLYMCSWTARRCNPACKRLAERLKAAGKAPKVINVAIAHKLLRQAFACAMKGEDFSAEWA